MSAARIARECYAKAIERAKSEGQDLDALARMMLSEVITSMLQRRSVPDVKSELLAAAENVDPDTDYMFMRP